MSNMVKDNGEFMFSESNKLNLGEMKYLVEGGFLNSQLGVKVLGLKELVETEKKRRMGAEETEEQARRAKTLGEIPGTLERERRTKIEQATKGTPLGDDVASAKGNPALAAVLLRNRGEEIGAYPGLADLLQAQVDAGQREFTATAKEEGVSGEVYDALTNATTPLARLAVRDRYFGPDSEARALYPNTFAALEAGALEEGTGTDLFKRLKGLTDIRQQFHTLSTDFRKLSSAWNGASALSAPALEGSPNAQRALVFAFNKILDRESTVRESEQEMVIKARSLVDGLLQRIEQGVTGQILTEDQIHDIIDASGAIFAAEAREHIHLEAQQIALAHREGLDRPLNAIIAYTNGIEDQFPQFDLVHGEEGLAKTLARELYGTAEGLSDEQVNTIAEVLELTPQGSSEE
jgi:hypothetical protein